MGPGFGLIVLLFIVLAALIFTPLLATDRKSVV